MSGNELNVSVSEAAIRKAGQVAIDAFIEDYIDQSGHLSPDDLGDYLPRIVDACVRAALSPQPVTKPAMGEGWMPIETAPKDETILLAVTHDEDGEPWSYVSQGRWIDGEDDQIDQPGHDAGFVDCEYMCFFPGRSFGAESSRHAGTQPTHWMPLPPPPAAKGEEL